MRIKDKTRVDDGDSEELTLTIVATAEEVDSCVEKYFKQISQRDIEGFRKGKAPRAVLEQSVGGHAPAMGAVAEMVINDYALKTIDDDGIIFISEPQFNVDKLLEEGKPFTFTASGNVAPLMKLTDYSPVAIEMPPEKASDAEVESQICELQDHYHFFEAIKNEGHTAAMGDHVEAMMTITNEGKVISGLGKASRMIGLGEGTMPESFDAQIIGAKVGDRLEFDFEAKNESGDSAFGDGNLHAVVDIKGFRKRIVPAIDDDLAAKIGCADVEDMRKQLRYTINMQKSKELPKLMVDRAISALVERLDGEVPAYYVDFIRQDVGRELMKSLEDQGTNLQQWLLENSIKGDKMKDDVAREAARRAAIDCALEALFLEKEWEINEEDIAEVFKDEEDIDEARKAWEEAHRIANVYKMCRQSKATKWLVETADVTIVEDILE